MTRPLKLITDPTPPELASAREFTHAMSALAAGVVIVTCSVDGRPWGMTVTAFASVSTDPPTVLVSLGSESIGARAIGVTGRFGVSILAEDQLPVAHHGSAPGAPKFLERFVAPRDAASASPAVAGALAHLDCEVAETVRVADHTLFVARVRAALAAHPGAPLLYHRRAYRTLADPPTERSTRCLAN
jgi:flavin reductase (DIM6/NTAB) family NADH-FMN oxidoreductase RutF